jgi:hypothetical protein
MSDKATRLGWEPGGQGSTPSASPKDMIASHTFEREHREQRGLNTDSWAIVKLKNSATGVPQSIIVEGNVKCIICGGFSENRLVCEDCADSVKLVRAAGNIEILKDLIDFASKPGNLAVFQALTDEAIGEMMMKRIRDARDGA